MLIFACVFAPLLATAVVAIRGFRPLSNKLPILASAIVALGGGVASQQQTVGVLGVLRADALSGFLVAVVGVTALLAGIGLNQQIAAGLANESIGPLRARAYVTAMPALVLCATATLCAHHQWLHLAGSIGVAVVGAAALIVARTRGAIKAAAWLAPSLIVSSVVITIGMMRAPHSVGAAGVPVAFILIGAAAYAGFVPAQWWRLRALSRLPAGLAAMASTATFVIGFDVLFRHASEVPWAAQWAGLLGLVVAGCGIAAGTDFVRTVAYMGLAGMSAVGFGLGAGTYAMVVSLRQVCVVAIATTVLYVVSSRLSEMTGSRRIDTVRGLWWRNRIAAVAFMTATLLIVVPLLCGIIAPSAAPTSWLVWSGLQSGNGLIFTVVLVASVAVVVGGTAVTMKRMLFSGFASHPDLAVTGRSAGGGREALAFAGALLGLVVAWMPSSAFMASLQVVALPFGVDGGRHSGESVRGTVGKLGSWPAQKPLCQTRGIGSLRECFAPIEKIGTKRSPQAR